MKRILITGAKGYVATSLRRYLGQWPQDYTVHTLSLRDESWKLWNFSGYDALVHAAGIVHQPQTLHDPAQAGLYHQVNVLLTQQLAWKAREEGVGQFLFLSTESVYGLTAPMGSTVTITSQTPLAPKDNYGRSKAEAEQILRQLETPDFPVAILRPPMIYGPGCKGNYVTLAKLARKLPVFPKVENKRSMLFIGNLCELIRLLIEDRGAGTFCPQNGQYSSTSRMVQLIAQAQGKNMPLVPGCQRLLRLLRPATGLVDKAFGSLCYDQSLSQYPKPYQLWTLDESIRITEGAAPEPNREDGHL